ncbi:MAG: Ig-like domain-containing protein [Myxococcota bacterium]
MSGRHAWVRLALLLTAPWWSACLVWLDVSDDTQVACTSDLDCPFGFVCRPSIGRCIRAGRDEEAPGVVADSVQLSPEEGVARALQRVEVTLRTTEPLFQSPDVTLGIPGTPRWENVAGGGTDWRFAYVPSGSEPEGTWPVLITMVDAAGNTATGVVVGTLTLDFTAPALLAVPSVGDTALRRDAQAAIQVNASEVLKPPPRLILRWPGAGVEREATWTPLATPSATHEFTYVADGTEPEGPAALHVELEDPAGNRAAVDTGASLRFDFTPARAVAGTVTVELTPPADALRQDVDAATQGTTVTVRFVLDEEVTGDPQVQTNTDPPLVFTAVPAPTGAWAYSVTLPTGTTPVQGEHRILLTTTDAAGNSEQSELGAFVVDTEAPAAPLVDEPGKVRYRRVPWGAVESDGNPRFQLLGGSGAAAAGALVVAYHVGAEENREVGRATAGSDGTFQLTLSPVDAPSVSVRVVDGAGNASPLVTVHDVEWVASLGGKVAGQTLGNPHRFEERFRVTGALHQADVVERGESDGVFRPGGTSLTTRGRGSWHNLSPRTGWIGRGEHAVASDPVRGRVVMFGGLTIGTRSCDGSGFAYCGGTWEWDGGGWTAARPPDPEGDGDPSPRIGHVMTFHSALGRVLMFGGKDPSGSCDGSDSVFCRSIWLWDGTSWERVPDGASAPQARLQSALAYDSARNRVVLFGGHTDANVVCTGGSFICGDTWEWDGNTWTAITPDDTGGDGNPSPRFGHAMVYDEERAQVLLFGGQETLPINVGESAQYVGDTWAFDGVRWTRLSTSGPGPRASHAMVYDPVQGRTLLTGGLLELEADQLPCPEGWTEKEPGCTVDDAWTWDGATWTEWIPTGGTTPADRFDHQLVFDARTGASLLVGGSLDVGDEGNLCPDGVLAGGQGLCAAGDTWRWDGAGWQRVGPSDPESDGQPVERSGHLLTTNTTTGEILLFGGRSNGPACDDVASRSCSALWAWRNGSWTRLSSGTPLGGLNRALLYQEHLDRTLLLGQFRRDVADCPNGAGTCDDSWTWDGQTWTPLSFAATDLNKRPPLRCGYSAAYDAAHDRVVLFGGYAYMDPDNPAALDCDAAESNQRRLPGLTYYDDTWLFDGTRWVLAVPGGRPEGVVPRKREDAAMVYDAARGEVVLFGGRRCFESPDVGDTCDVDEDYEYHPETWVWSGSAWEERASGPETPDALSWPLARRSPMLAYDASRQRVVLFGGDAGGLSDCGTASRFCKDQWEWNGTSWTRVESADPEGDLAPSARVRSAMAHDPQRGELLLFGGNGGLDDTWAWNGAADSHPAHVAHVLLQAAGIPGGAQLTRAQVLWRAGARTEHDGNPVGGVRLYLWDRGGWRLAGQGTGEPGATADLSFETGDPSLLRRLAAPADQTLHLMLAPLDENGAGGGHATVETDHFEIALTYRTP